MKAEIVITKEKKGKVGFSSAERKTKKRGSIAEIMVPGLFDTQAPT